MKDKIKILITDDHPIIRRGLKMVISSAPNLEIVGEAENGEIALKLIRSLHPDIVVLDIDMPILDGIETAKLVFSNFPDVKVIFLTMHKDKGILDVLSKLHVKGYVLKDSAVLEIVDCINQVITGKIFTSPVISDLLKKAPGENPLKNNEYSAISELSSNEIRILQRISESKTNREIAEEMFLSIRTVENHRFNICTKLKIRGKHALLIFTLENKEIIFANVKDK